MSLALALLLGAPGAHAASTKGSTWTCYVLDRMPDLEEAAGWGKARALSRDMNAIAPDAPAGSTIVVVLTTFMGWKQTPVVCTKK